MIVQGGVYMDLHEFAQWLKDLTATERIIEKNLRAGDLRGPAGDSQRSAPDWWQGRISAFEDVSKMFEPILAKIQEREGDKDKRV
jgi:hypothetical protein